MKKKVKLDKDIHDIFTEILIAQKITNSKNMNFMLSLIGARNTLTTTKEGAEIISRYLDPVRFPKTRDLTILNKYKKYEYAYLYLNLSIKGETNIKTKLLPQHKEIDW